MIRIREAQRADLALIHQFIRELAEYERLADDCTGTMEELDESLFGAAPCAKTLLAFWSGEPAGFALYFFMFSTFKARPVLYLEDLFVKPDLRGQGIGQRLFDELKAAARRGNCARFEWSVLNWNEPAIRFYDRLGAEPQSEWIKYRLTDQQF